MSAFAWQVLLVVVTSGLNLGPLSCKRNHDAERDLDSAGVGLSKNRTYAFVPHTGGGERMFGDDNLRQAIQPLSRLRYVKTLDVTGTSITDRSVRDIATLKIVQELNLIDTAVSQQGLMELAQMSSLKILLLDGECLSEEDLARIQRKLPHVDIYFQKKVGPLTQFTKGPPRYKRIPPA